MRWMLVCVALLPCIVSAQEAQKPDAKPAATTAASPVDAGAAKLVNPVKPTAVSLASGKKTYATDCAMCHGKTGGGDGDLAGDMKLTLKDFRDPEVMKAMSDGEIYMSIEKGKGQMQGEEGRLKPHQIWDVVNYLRSFSKK